MSVENKIVDLQMLVAVAVTALVFSFAGYAIIPNQDSGWLWVSITLCYFALFLLVLLHVDYNKEIKEFLKGFYES